MDRNLDIAKETQNWLLQCLVFCAIVSVAVLVPILSIGHYYHLEGTEQIATHYKIMEDRANEDHQKQMAKIDNNHEREIATIARDKDVNRQNHQDRLDEIVKNEKASLLAIEKNHKERLGEIEKNLKVELAQIDEHRKERVERDDKNHAERMVEIVDGHKKQIGADHKALKEAHISLEKRYRFLDQRYDELLWKYSSLVGKLSRETPEKK